MYEFKAEQLTKLSRLNQLNIEPYPNNLEKPANLVALLPVMRELSIYDLEHSGTFVLAGRLRFKNEMGSMGFARIEDEGEFIQLCIRKNTLTNSDDFQAWKLLDIGDLVWVTGTFMRTRTGELSLDVRCLKLYAKCIEGMPDKLSGVSDPETKQRMRYLDLIVNDESRARFALRSRIISKIRSQFEALEFMEVETPILQSIPGGASARPFITHHNSLDAKMYLRIAPELYLKRLVVGGFPRVFEIGRNFRNEGLSTKHNPEFTMIEFYAAHHTYLDLIVLIKGLIVKLLTELNIENVIKVNDAVVNLSEFTVISYEELLRIAGVENPWSVESLQDFLMNKLSIERTQVSDSLSELWTEVFDRYVEKTLVNPTFVTHFPTAISPLARKSDLDSRVTDRFELYIAGNEIANGFSELNDPIDQAARFAEQVRQKESGDDEAMYFDHDYIKALSYGMPPTAGAGIGIDRLVMLLTQTSNIRDVILFPTLRTK